VESFDAISWSNGVDKIIKWLPFTMGKMGGM